MKWKQKPKTNHWALVFRFSWNTPHKFTCSTFQRKAVCYRYIWCIDRYAVLLFLFLHKYVVISIDATKNTMSQTHKLHAKQIVHIGHVAHFKAVEHVISHFFSFFSLFFIDKVALFCFSFSLSSIVLCLSFVARLAGLVCRFLAWQHNFREL